MKTNSHQNGTSKESAKASARCGVWLECFAVAIFVSAVVGDEVYDRLHPPSGKEGDYSGAVAGTVVWMMVFLAVAVFVTGVYFRSAVRGKERGQDCDEDYD
jgi:hypothetical protein